MILCWPVLWDNPPFWVEHVWEITDSLRYFWVNFITHYDRKIGFTCFSSGNSGVIKWPPIFPERSELTQIVSRWQNPSAAGWVRQMYEMIQRKTGKKNDQCSKPWLIVLYRGLYSTLMGIVINQYNDPYEPTSTMKSKRVFFMDDVDVSLWQIFHVVGCQLMRAIFWPTIFFPSKLYKGRGFSHCFFKWKQECKRSCLKKFIPSIHLAYVWCVCFLTQVWSNVYMVWYQKHVFFFRPCKNHWCPANGTCI